MNPTLPSESAPAAASRKVWKVGTLTYTAGGIVALFVWLLWGDFAWSMRDRSIPPVITLLFKNYGSPDTLTGILIGSLPALLGLVLNPIVSYRSDRLRSRLGRRIPYLILSTPVIVIGLVGLAFSPPLGTMLSHWFGPVLGATLATLIFLALFWTLFEVGCVVSMAVFNALVNDVVPQVLLGRFYGLFRAVSLFAGMLFNFWIVGKSETHHMAIFLGMAILYGIGFTVMLVKVKEGGYPPPPEPQAPGKAGGFLPAVRSYFRDCFTKPYYLLCFLSGIIGGAANIPFNLFVLLYVKSIGLSLETYGRYIALTYLISFALSYPLGALADRFHPLRLTIAVQSVFALVTLACGLFIESQASFLVGLVALGVIAGAYYTASASLGARLLPRAKFAELSSAGGILGAGVNIVLAPAVGFILDQSGHNYRYTFYMGFVLAAVSIVLFILLYRRFLQYGGPAGYVAPE